MTPPNLADMLKSSFLPQSQSLKYYIQEPGRQTHKNIVEEPQLKLLTSYAELSYASLDIFSLKI